MTRQAFITFANGVRATADVVIAADGIHSSLQQFVVAPSAPLFSGSVACRGISRRRACRGRPARCATGLERASTFSSFRCAAASSSTTSAS